MNLRLTVAAAEQCCPLEASASWYWDRQFYIYFTKTPMDYRKPEVSMTRKLTKLHTKKTKSDFECLPVVGKIEVLAHVKNSFYCFFGTMVTF